MKHRSAFAVVLAAWLGAGCAYLASLGRSHSISVPVVRPAEIDLRPYPRVAVGDFDGNLGEDFADALRSRLVASGAFEVLDRSRLDQVLREVGLARSRLTEAGSRAGVGRLRTALVLFTGRAEGSYEEGLAHAAQTCGPKEKPYACTRWTRSGTARTRGVLEIVDAQTGRILASRPLTGACESRTEAVDARPAPIDSRGLFDRCLTPHLDTLFTAMSQRIESVKVVFRTYPQVPLLETGVARARTGDFATAAATFEEAAARAAAAPPETGVEPFHVAAAWRNAGLAHTYAWQFDRAVDAFRKANLHDSSPEYERLILEAERLRAERARLALPQPPAR